MILFAHNPHYTRENYAEIVDDDIEDKRTKPEDREEAFSKFIFAELNTDWIEKDYIKHLDKHF